MTLRKEVQDKIALFLDDQKETDLALRRLAEQETAIRHRQYENYRKTFCTGDLTREDARNLPNILSDGSTIICDGQPWVFSIGSTMTEGASVIVRPNNMGAFLRIEMPKESEGRYR